jgi:4-hydroxybenzoate polyprenyltransferase
MTHPRDNVRETSKLLAYLQLFRAPNVFTAVADVAMGFLFVQQSLLPPLAFLLLAGASVILYMAGMALNDVCDFEDDLRQRPTRPLPAGRISRVWAKWLAYELMLVGVALGWLGGYAASGNPMAWRSGLVVCLLAACIWLYDVALKRTLIGPWLMGACRFLNVLLGMSIAPKNQALGELWLFTSEQLLVAAGMGVYVAGITWYARYEASSGEGRGTLVFGTVVMAAGICLLAFFPQLAATQRAFFIEPTFIWPMAVFLISVSILRRCLAGALDPHSQRIQAAVKQCLMSIIILDASVCLLTCPWYWAVGVLVLLAPAMMLGRWVYST